MSRNHVQLREPVEFLGVSGITLFAYGPDHAVGYFIQGFDDEDECILDRDMLGMCMSETDTNGRVPLTKADIAAFLSRFVNHTVN